MATTTEDSNSGAAPAGGAGYLPKNILITGGAGFIASHVVILLAEKYPQYNIVNLDRLDYCACLENLECLNGKPNYKVSYSGLCLCRSRRFEVLLLR